jgi:hypothetical protein
MLENWTPVAIDEAKLPDSLSLDDAPLAWENDHDGKVITVKPDPREEYEWAVAGPNSIIRTANTLDGAKKKARQYMHKTRRPSGMV